MAVVAETYAPTSLKRPRHRADFRAVLWRFEGDKIAERWATVTPPGKETDQRPIRTSEEAEGGPSSPRSAGMATKDFKAWGLAARR